jgi:hypothetical protein
MDTQEALCDADVLTHIADHPVTRLDQLQPWNWLLRASNTQDMLVAWAGSDT